MGMQNQRPRMPLVCYSGLGLTQAILAALIFVFYAGKLGILCELETKTSVFYQSYRGIKSPLAEECPHADMAAVHFYIYFASILLIVTGFSGIGTANSKRKHRHYWENAFLCLSLFGVLLSFGICIAVQFDHYRYGLSKQMRIEAMNSTSPSWLDTLKGIQETSGQAQAINFLYSMGQLLSMAELVITMLSCILIMCRAKQDNEDVLSNDHRLKQDGYNMPGQRNSTYL